MPKKNDEPTLSQLVEKLQGELEVVKTAFDRVNDVEKIGGCTVGLVHKLSALDQVQKLNALMADGLEFIDEKVGDIVERIARIEAEDRRRGAVTEFIKDAPVNGAHVVRGEGIFAELEKIARAH